MGDGGTTRGINENNTVVDRHELLSIHMPAYSDSIIKGVATVMISYSSWNGEKMHANHDLVTGFLKGTLKFKVTISFSFFLYFYLYVASKVITVFLVTIYNANKMTCAERFQFELCYYICTNI